MTDGDAESAPVAPGAGQDAEIAPESKQKCSPGFLGFDPQGGLQLIGGLVIGLIALYSSYDHINVVGRVILLKQQWGIWFIAASLAVVVVDAQLASRSRLRAANEAAENRDRRREEALARVRDANEAARREAAQFLRARVEADSRQAQLAYLAQPSVANREQLEQVLSKLSRPEVRALFEDEALAKALGLRP